MLYLQKGEMVPKLYRYVIVFLAIVILFPFTPRVVFGLISILSGAEPFPLTVRVVKQNQTVVIPGISGAERIVAIDPRMTYIGDDKGGNLEYNKEFSLQSVGSKNTLSLGVAGMVAVCNDNESADYHNGFFINKLYINGHYIDNLNNYVYQEEDRTFRTIRVPLPSHALRPGINRLMITAECPKCGNHDDFAFKEIKLFQQ